MEHNLIECENEQCRTCLMRPTELISLVADHVVCDKVMSVLDLIKTCTSVQIEVEDGLPQFACLDCIRSAEKSFEFRVQCEQADTTLRSELTTMNIIDLSDNEHVSNDMEIEYEVLDQEKTDLEFPELAVDRNEDEDDDNIEMEVERLDEDEEDTDSEKNHDNNQIQIKCEEINLSEEVEIPEAYSCHVCDLIFPTPAALSKHSTTAHPPSFYQCPHCPVRFISQHLLDKHVIKHLQNKDDPEKPRIKYHKRKGSVDYICAICGKKYSRMTTLQIHVRKHTFADQDSLDCTNLTCNICEQQFTGTAELQMHMETVHNLKSEIMTQPDSDDGSKVKTKFGCTCCFKMFTSANLLQQHVEIHGAAERKKRELNKSVSQNRVAYKCTICSHEVNSLPEIKDHLSTHSVDSKSIFQHLLYKCSECQLDFGTIYEYFGHMSSHAPAKLENTKGGVTRAVRKRPHVCDEPGCDKAFPSPSALRNHMKTHQNRWPKKCRYCDDMMSKWNDYMTHLNQMHEDKKTYVCSQCGKKFFKERNLQNHVRTHTGERNYMCDFCGFSFHAQNNLIAHRRIHTGVKPYKCTYCPQAFSQHAGLRSHLLNHTGEKKYECPTCHKKFLRIGAMKNHIKTHTGVKDYACHICGARFGASSTRKKHLLTHTGERNHICDFCGKAFSRKSNLSVHIKIHTGETPHVCEVCGKGFIQAHVLRSHMNTHRKRSELGTTKRIVKSRKQVTINEEMKLESDDSQELPVLVELGD